MGFRKITQISHLMKIHLVDAEFYADERRQTGRRDKANSRSLEFCGRA